MGEVVVVQIARSKIQRLRDRLIEAFTIALDFSDGEVTAGDLLDMAMEERVQAWVALDVEKREPIGFAATEVVRYPRMSCLRVTVLQGPPFDRWKDRALEVFQEFAASQGLDNIEVVGRLGWERKLRDMGFRKRYVVLTKEVEYGKDSGDDAAGLDDWAAPYASAVS